MSAAQTPEEIGHALLALSGDDFAFQWPQLDETVRISIPQPQRQACIERYRRLTPWYERSIERLARAAPAVANVPTRRFAVLTAEDVINLPPLRWLVRGVLPATGQGCMYGASGSGKSFLALDLAAAVAEGAPWFDCRVTAAPVVYAALEGEAGFAQRVQGWQIHHGQALPNALRFIMQGFDLRHADDIDALSTAVGDSGCAGGLLVIDTLNRAASGADENTSRDMGEVIAACKRLQAELGGLVMLVHHNGKDASKGMRGHSSLFAALDAAIEVTRNGDQREWCVAKSKDGSDGARHAFTLKVAQVGTHDDGEPITSCAVVADDKPAAPRRALPPTSGNQRVIWDGLGELLREAGDARPKDAPDRLPHGRPAITLDCAITRLRERLACDPKRRTERAQQALTGLHARGLIAIDGGYVWVT